MTEMHDVPYDDAPVATAPRPRLVDPVAVVEQLRRELDAGRALVSLSVDDHQRRRAALDLLQLAGDLLDDARRELARDLVEAAGRG